MRAEMPPVPDRLRLIGWCSAPGLAAAVGSLRGWPDRWVTLGVVALVVLAAVLWPSREKPATKAPEKPPARQLLGVVLFVAAIVFAFACLAAARLTVLDLVGRPTVAHIGDVERERIPTRSARLRIDFCYDMLAPDGEAYTGRLCRDGNEYRRGEAVEVLAEPTGLVAPETPDRVAAVTWPRNIALGAFLLICLTALLGGGPAPRERPLVPPGRYPAWRRLPPQPERRHRPRRRPRRNRGR